MNRLKVYLAGPDVFLRNARAFGEEKKKICAAHGFEGAFPLDNELSQRGADRLQFAMAISRANEDLMDRCDLIIANMTPFRGPSMDVGTAYEMGYMRARGKPVFAYSNVVPPYLERVRESPSGPISSPADATRFEDRFGMEVEDFGLLDNLMLEGAVRTQGGQIIVGGSSGDGGPRDDAGHDAIFRRLDVFRACVAFASDRLGVEAS